jgi:PAS domain S-box-containing protein
MRSLDDHVAKVIHDPRIDGSVKAAIARVRDSEKRLRALVQATSYITYRMSPDWTVMYQLDGHGALADTRVPTLDWQDEYLFKEDRAAILAAVHDAIAARSMFDLEHRVRRADQSIGWVHSRAVPVFDDDGGVVEWFGAASDITDRKASEQIMREQLTELEQVYAMAPVGLALLSPDLVFLRINERLAEINGIPAPDHIGRRLADLVPSLLAQIEAIRDGFLAGGGPVLKILSGETAAKPGVIRHWEERWSPLRDPAGALKGLSVVVEEITERKRINDALAQSEERFRLAAAAAGLGTWDFDLSAGWGVWDGPALQMMGLPADEPAYDSSGWLKPVAPSDWNRLKAAYKASLQDGGQPYRVEFRGAVPAADGGERWLASFGAVLRDETGKPRRAIGFVQDITDQRRREERLKASEARFRASQEVASNGFTILRAVRDQAGTIVDFIWEYANPAAREMLGVENTPLDGESLLTRLPENKDHPDLFPRYVRALEAGRGDEVELHYSAHGIDGWFHNALTVIDADRIGVAYRNITEQKTNEVRRQLLVNELNHRVKNSLAIVQAIARQTFRSKASAPDVQAFSDRLAALASAHNLLTQSDWQAAEVADIVQQTCNVHAFDRINAAGPSVGLSPAAALSLSMAVHELCTNAAKYGALSNDLGSVSVTWRCADDVFEFVWRESGGPPVAQPTHRGFGTRMIKAALQGQPGGEVELRFEPDGLICEMRMQMDRGASTKLH